MKESEVVKPTIAPELLKPVGSLGIVTAATVIQCRCSGGEEMPVSPFAGLVPLFFQ